MVPLYERLTLEFYAEPNSQLQTWTNQGSITNSSNTHWQIRNVLAKHDWPDHMRYADYLQGSYANTTNIRGDSDVDIVIECTSVFRHNLTDEKQKVSLGFQPGSHSLAQFRNQVIKALVHYFGEDAVDTEGANSVCVIPSDTSSKLYADVIICTKFKNYNKDLSLRGEGIAFVNRRNQKLIINYPKLHIANGKVKMSDSNSDYKKAVRMFKNARRYLIDRTDGLEGLYPSYFVECLIYNLPDEIIKQDAWNKVFVEALLHWEKIVNADAFRPLVTQSRMHQLIGNSCIQWPKANAISFIENMIYLWNNWYE